MPEEYDFSDPRADNNVEFEQTILEDTNLEIYSACTALVTGETDQAIIRPYTLQRLPFRLILDRKDRQGQNQDVYVGVGVMKDNQLYVIHDVMAESTFQLRSSPEGLVMDSFIQNPTQNQSQSDIRIKKYVYAIEQVQEQLAQVWADTHGQPVREIIEPRFQAIVDSLKRRGGFKRLETDDNTIKYYKDFIPSQRSQNG